MSRIKIISVALLIATALVVTAEGQESQIGNGRLLKKFRDDVFGVPNQPKGNAQNKNAQQSTHAQMQSRQGQPQQNQSVSPQTNQNQNRSSGLFRSPQFANQTPQANQQQRQPNQRQPQQQVQQPVQQPQPTRQHQPQVQSGSRNPNGSINRNDPRYRGQAQNQPRTQGQSVGNSNQLNQPTQNQLDYYRRKGSPSNLTSPRNIASQQPQQQAPSPIPSQTFEPQPVNPQYSQTQPNENRMIDKAATLVKAKRRGPQSAGFGLELNVDKEEQIYIADVDRKGNAAKAGLKKGDLLLEIGGAKLASVEEFDEIAKVMKDGDQLELKVSRRGRTSVVPLQFGEAPELPENSEVQPADNLAPQVLRTQNQPNDFVPDSETAGAVTLDSGVEEAPSPPVSVDRPELPEIDLEIDTPNSVLDLDSSNGG